MEIYSQKKKEWALTYVKERVTAVAKACMDAGVPIDDSPDGAIVEWIRRNVKYNREDEFFVVFLTACEMAEMKKRAA